jgi:hypothetical protein
LKKKKLSSPDAEVAAKLQIRRYIYKIHFQILSCFANTVL